MLYLNSLFKETALNSKKMKHSSYLLALIVILLNSCNSKQKQFQFEQIIYPGATHKSLTELMSSIEIVRLQHGDSLLIDDKIRLFQRDSSFYIADIRGEKIIYRFNRDGRFLNKIGKKGKAPQEHPNMLDVSVGENNNIYILSAPYLILTQYAQNGDFKEKKRAEINSNGFCRSGNGFWVYTGNPERTYLLRLDDSLNVIDSLRLPKGTIDTQIYPFERFSSFGDNSYFWQYPFPMVYSLTPNAAKQTICFDFGDNYISSEDMQGYKPKIDNKDIVNISKYYENESQIFVEIGIIGKDKKSARGICGLKNKPQNQWYWAEYITTPEKPFIPDWYPTRTKGFAQDGRLMCFFFGNEIEELTDEARKLITNPQELENIDPEMDMFVLLCRFK